LEELKIGRTKDWKNKRLVEQKIGRTKVAVGSPLHKTTGQDLLHFLAANK
jgi:hypothetical protein